MQSVSASGSTLPGREGGRSVSVPQGRESLWTEMVRLVAAEYPYCTMHGVHVADGVIVACEGVQRSFAFGGDEAVEAAVHPAFDAHWKALEALCANMGSGRLVELRFSRGRPVSARTSESGRRFRRIVGKPAAEGHKLLS